MGKWQETVYVFKEQYDKKGKNINIKNTKTIFPRQKGKEKNKYGLIEARTIERSQVFKTIRKDGMKNSHKGYFKKDETTLGRMKKIITSKVIPLSGTLGTSAAWDGCLFDHPLRVLITLWSAKNHQLRWSDCHSGQPFRLPPPLDPIKYIYCLQKSPKWCPWKSAAWGGPPLQP